MSGTFFNNWIRLRIPALIAAIGIVSLSFANEAEKPPIQWNRDASSSILSPDTASKRTPGLPSWKLKQMAWPSDAEIRDHSVVVDTETKESCMQWLDKFIAPNALPKDIDRHLIAMKEWGVIKEVSKQKSLCDVFLVRYQIGSQIIQIQESPFNVVIIYADEQNLQKPRTDRQAYILEVSKSLLRETLLPNPGSDEFHVNEKEVNGQNWTKATWLLASVVVVRPDGIKATSISKAWEIGTRHVVAETNGTIIRFEIIKSTNSARAFFDPYEKRFGE